MYISSEYKNNGHYIIFASDYWNGLQKSSISQARVFFISQYINSIYIVENQNNVRPSYEEDQPCHLFF